MAELKLKSPSETRVTMTDLILPAQANHMGTIFGGEVMSYVDRLGAICAARHARNAVVTASFDSLDFLAPIKVGQMIILNAVITWSGRTSMEVQVTVEAEDLISGDRQVTGVCYLTFVALDKDGKPAEVPRIEPVTEEENFQYRLAQERRKHRQQRRAKHHAAP